MTVDFFNIGMTRHAITIVGSGYVGLVTGACLAKLGHRVVCHDIDTKKISLLKRGSMPFFEPGLREIILQSVRQKRLTFESDPVTALRGSEVIFITVGTPSRKDGSVDISYVKSAAKSIAANLRGGEIIVSKSTVPIGASLLLRRSIQRTFSGHFSIVSNPEFLREGVALGAFLKADRIILGYEQQVTARVKKIMREIYAGIKAPIIETNNRTAELIKYAANVFLASHISFINSIARLCEEIGADVEVVSAALKADPRIGQRAFLSAGIGYGGLCFPKDIRALIRISQKLGYRFKFLDVVDQINKDQRKFFVQRIRMLVPKIKGKKVALLGLSFKPQTDDLRDAPSLDIIKSLLRAGAKLHVTDPVAINSTRRIFGSLLTYHRNPYDALRGAHVAAIITEWPQFTALKLEKMKKLLAEPNIVDGRNIYDPETMRHLGFRYIGIGRGYIREIFVKK